MPYTDKQLTCVDCGASFTFSADDQEFHASRGFTNEPKRCPDCRRARKAARGDVGGGGGSYGGGGGCGCRMAGQDAGLSLAVLAVFGLLAAVRRRS